MLWYPIFIIVKFSANDIDIPFVCDHGRLNAHTLIQGGIPLPQPPNVDLSLGLKNCPPLRVEKVQCPHDPSGTFWRNLGQKTHFFLLPHSWAVAILSPRHPQTPSSIRTLINVWAGYEKLYKTFWVYKTKTCLSSSRRDITSVDRDLNLESLRGFFLKCLEQHVCTRFEKISTARFNDVTLPLLPKSYQPKSSNLRSYLNQIKTSLWTFSRISVWLFGGKISSISILGGPRTIDRGKPRKSLRRNHLRFARLR